MLRGFVLTPARPAPEAGAQTLHHLGDRRGAVGAEVERPRRRARVVEQALGQQQVAVQRLEHVLPRPQRLRVAKHDRLGPLDRANDVGDDAVDRPVAAADHVARAGRREADAPIEVARAR